MNKAGGNPRDDQRESHRENGIFEFLVTHGELAAFFLVARMTDGDTRIVARSISLTGEEPFLSDPVVTLRQDGTRGRLVEAVYTIGAAPTPNCCTAQKILQCSINVKGECEAPATRPTRRPAPR